MKVGKMVALVLAVVLLEFLGYILVQASFTPIDNYLIACGSSQNVTFQGRTFVPDDDDHSSLSLKVGSSFVASSNNSSVPSPVYQSARVFTSIASYKFDIEQKGRHWVRFYFYPLPTPDGHNLTSAPITVVTDEYVLLNNFTFEKYNGSFMFKEYAIKVTSDTLTLTFIPPNNSVSFVNAIEVVSIPDAILPDKASGLSDKASVLPDNPIEVYLSEFAMETVYRLNMGGPLITAQNDTLGRTWENDMKYLSSNMTNHHLSADVSVNPTLIRHTTRVTPETAPNCVYATAKIIEYAEMSISHQATWVFHVDPKFRYFVRAHFCNIISKSIFNLYINYGTSAFSNSETKELYVPEYKGFVSNPLDVESGSLTVSIGSIDKINGILNGLEIMKISNDAGSLDGFSSVKNLLAVANKEKDKGKVVVVTTLVVGTIFITVSAFLLLTLVAKHRGRGHQSKQNKSMLNKRKEMAKFFANNMTEENINEVELQQLPLFNFKELVTATKNFHLTKKLGHGGFGPVYKGTVENGKEIAVKRLSKASSQGLEEFINEVVVISKLQHRNLVRLLGCCVEGEEKMLVYEFMPNKSLDSFLFDPCKQIFLDWKKRFNIIEGISRGLLYLHRDSRMRIIHRDLKASNVLLDNELNPKISDFGMAKMFKEDESQANTRRVVGTYGYMSPEYAIHGQFSEKSDVFSFGVLLLEIISGRKNTSFYNNQHFLSLLAYAWNLWEEDNMLELVDKSVFDSSYHIDTLRCIHVGLLCVQDSPKDRPTMSTVISMLNTEIVDLPTPKQPAFIDRYCIQDAKTFEEDKFTVNDVTLTDFYGR